MLSTDQCAALAVKHTMGKQGVRNQEQQTPTGMCKGESREIDMVTVGLKSQLKGTTDHWKVGGFNSISRLAVV